MEEGRQSAPSSALRGRYYFVKLIVKLYFSSSSYEVYVMAMNEYGVGEESSRIVFRTASRTLADLQVKKSI